jgi:hypothetical protein
LQQRLGILNFHYQIQMDHEKEQKEEEFVFPTASTILHILQETEDTQLKKAKTIISDYMKGNVPIQSDPNGLVFVIRLDFVLLPINGARVTKWLSNGGYSVTISTEESHTHIPFNIIRLRIPRL